MNDEKLLNTDLQTSKRFQSPKERRDFLGLAAIWAAVGSIAWGLIGALRLPMPSVFPESNPKIKLGPFSQFQEKEMTAYPEHRLWIYKDSGGLYALSSVCTHLGCIVSRQNDGYFCPCHGSVFDKKGNVISGPAPRALDYLELTISPDGQLVVDTQKKIESTIRLAI